MKTITGQKQVKHYGEPTEPSLTISSPAASKRPAPKLIPFNVRPPRFDFGRLILAGTKAQIGHSQLIRPDFVNAVPVITVFFTVNILILAVSKVSPPVSSLNWFCSYGSLQFIPPSQ